MGYMGFGMRKEVYQRKPKKISVNYRYKKNKKDKLKPEQKDFTSVRYQTPLIARVIRVLIYKIIPLAFILTFLYFIVTW